jgi:hypothetical protein
MGMTDSLGIPRDTLAAIILHARAWDAQTGTGASLDSSNATDDGVGAILTGGRSNPVGAELRAEIESLSEDEQAALVALAWIGRGDFDASEWDEACATARERATGPTSRYLMQMPMVGDYLEDGAAALGVDLADEESDLLYGEEQDEED